MVTTKDIRNIVLLGHGGSGKTSLTEAILHKTGATNRLGSIDDKTTVCDYYEEEKRHHHSIHSALVNTMYSGKMINIIDTPGYPDFIGSSIKSVPAVETAVIVINGSAGIETNTRKFFKLAEEYNKPRILVINRIDAENIDFPELIKSIKDNFGSQCQLVNLPTMDKTGVINCIEKTSGQSPAADVEPSHNALIESVIEVDDKLMEGYLGGETITTEQVSSVFLKALQAGTVTPILFTDARKEVGIIELLDFIAKYSPSPVDAVAKIKEGETMKELKADPSGPLAGLVFRVGFDPKSNMKQSAIRIFSGTLKSDTNMMVGDGRKGLRPGHVLKSQGAEHKEIEAGIAGDIVMLAKLEELKLGDLIHDGRVSGHFEMPAVPEPMYSLAIEPAARGDEVKLGSCLDKLSEEDPCFKAKHNVQTKELVMSGLGEMHLRIILEKMDHNFKLSVTTKQPKIPYKETISGKADGHYRHKKQSGGSGQFGEVYLRVEPAERESDPTLQYSWDIFGGSIPKQFEPGIIKGINDVMVSGVIAGYPLQDVKVSIYDGKYHAVDSKEVAFRAAGKGAFIEAIKNAKPVLLEPIVNIEITIPADNMEDITGDLASKRGRVLGQEMLAGNMMVIEAQVPLSEVTQYNSQLKSVTGGRGSYSMTLSHYDIVPSNIQQQIVSASVKVKEEEE